MSPVFRSKIKNINELRLTRVLFLVSLFLLMSGKGWSQTATISGNTTVCQGAAAPDITFTGANGTAPYTFTYTINSGTNQTVTTDNGNSVVTVPVPTGVAGTFKYNMVSVTDADNNTASVPGSVTVTVNPLPTAAAGTITGTPTVCQGQTGVNYSVPVITNATGYVWTLPAGATISAGANTNSITVDFSAIAASGDITVQGSNSCGTGTVSATYPVIVNPLPPTSAIYHQ